MTYKNLIVDLQKKHKKYFMNEIVKYDEIISYLNKVFPEEIDLKLKIFCYINNLTPTCKYNNKIEFLRWDRPKYCGIKCQCIKDKVKKTNLIKYGVENPAQNIQIKQKYKETINKKYGVDNISKSEIIKNKKKETFSKNYPNIKSSFNLESYKKTINKKYGVDNISKSEIIKNKKKETNLKNLGVEVPILNSMIKNKIQTTMIDRYGVKTPLENKNILAQMKKNNLKKWGFEFPRQNTNFVEAARSNYFNRNGVNHYRQKEWSLETWQQLNDLSLIIYNIKQNGITFVADKLGVHKTTLYRYLKNDERYNYYDFLNNKSILEEKLKVELHKLNINFVERTRDIISPYEIDVYLPDYRLGIELHGLYWHSEQQNTNINYHSIKYYLANKNNIILLQFYENEINDKFDIIINIIKSKIKANRSNVYARQTGITEISAKLANEFLNKHHLQGSTPMQGIRIGAWKELELVGVMTFQPKKDGYELTRFASFGNISGLASKMLKYFSVRYKPKWIQSFSDNRISNGDLYKKLNFKFEKELPPTYYYTDYTNVFHRFNFRKKLIEKRFGLDMSNKTEKTAMIELGYDRIWDAGKKEWKKYYD